MENNGFSREYYHEYYMEMALDEARAAYAANEVPIGCVVTDAAGAVIARGRNRCAEEKNALRHAEVVAIEEVWAKTGGWGLSECTMYVTVEPCPMCAGTIIMAKIGSVVFGARNPKAGCGGSILNILCEPRFNHRANVVGGVLADECGTLMRDFFKNKRGK